MLASRFPDAFPTDPSGLPPRRPPEVLELEDGGVVELHIAPVAARLGEATVRMLAYNGSVPGPVLRVREGSRLVVHVRNDGDTEATVHWHGLRLDNRYDGTLDTQAPIPVGGRFTYRLTFPDPGIYWYHPHIREDYNQELGLQGAIVVVPSDPGYWPPAHRELVLTLDDILLEDGRAAAFRRSGSTHTAMGRFGDLLLTNGALEPTIAVRRGEVVRLHLVDTANARVFEVGVRGARMKLVGGDSGRCEHEAMVETVRLSPSERAVVDLHFDGPGPAVLEHRTPARTYRLAGFEVGPDAAEPALCAAFADLRTNAEMAAERARIAPYLDAPPQRTLALVAEMDVVAPDAPGATCFACPMHPEVRAARPERCPRCGMKLLPEAFVDAAAGGAHAAHGAHDHVHGDAPGGGGDGIEWEDDMAAVNRLTTPADTRWRLVDRSGGEAAGGEWVFRVGDQVKIRLVNEMDSDHPMHHPVHVHGAGRFLVLSRDGVAEPNLVWKDTVLVTTGETVDILLDVTNPGTWMLHCHIAEHHEGGMMLRLRVTP